MEMNPSSEGFNCYICEDISPSLFLIMSLTKRKSPLFPCVIAEELRIE